MKSGLFWLAVVWFFGSTYLGYRLTERSFSWIAQPNDGQPASAVTVPVVKPIDLKALEKKIPPALLEKAKTLSATQLLCLKSSIAPARVSAVLAGDLTPQEAAAVKKCLE
jgi:hypothetical protein